MDVCGHLQAHQVSTSSPNVRARTGCRFAGTARLRHDLKRRTISRMFFRRLSNFFIQAREGGEIERKPLQYPPHLWAAASQKLKKVFLIRLPQRETVNQSLFLQELELLPITALRKIEHK